MGEKKDTFIKVRMSESDKEGLRELAEQLGYKSVSALVRNFKGLYDRLCDELDERYEGE